MFIRELYSPTGMYVRVSMDEELHNIYVFVSDPIMNLLDMRVFTYDHYPQAADYISSLERYLE